MAVIGRSLHYLPESERASDYQTPATELRWTTARWNAQVGYPTHPLLPEIELSITFVVLVYQVHRGSPVIVAHVHIIQLPHSRPRRVFVSLQGCVRISLGGQWPFSLSPSLLPFYPFTRHTSRSFPVLAKGLLTPSCLLVGLMRLTNVDSVRFRAIDVGLSCFSTDIKADIRIWRIRAFANARETRLWQLEGTGIY